MKPTDNILSQRKEFERSMLKGDGSIIKSDGFNTHVDGPTLLPPTKWVVVPMVYEKWVNPANKNDKHYHAIFRSPTGRRTGKTKFKTATAVLAFAERYHRHLCNPIIKAGDMNETGGKVDGISEQGDQGA